MNYVKTHATPLLIGLAVGYFIAKRGGLKAAVGGVTSSVKGAV